MSIGLLSQGTGIFENAFCVPVNRASSILAGVLATAVLSVWLGQRGIGLSEALGAVLVIAAMGVLSVPTLMKARRARSEAKAVAPARTGSG